MVLINTWLLRLAQFYNNMFTVQLNRSAGSAEMKQTVVLNFPVVVRLCEQINMRASLLLHSLVRIIPASIRATTLLRLLTSQWLTGSVVQNNSFSLIPGLQKRVSAFVFYFIVCAIL